MHGTSRSFRFANTTADNPTRKPGRRTDRDGNPIPDDFFENDPDEATGLKSEAVTEKQLAKEEEAIDKFLDGDDSAFDDLDY